MSLSSLSNVFYNYPWQKRIHKTLSAQKFSPTDKTHWLSAGYIKAERCSKETQCMMGSIYRSIAHARQRIREIILCSAVILYSFKTDDRSISFVLAQKSFDKDVVVSLSLPDTILTATRVVFPRWAQNGAVTDRKGCEMFHSHLPLLLAPKLCKSWTACGVEPPFASSFGRIERSICARSCFIDAWNSEKASKWGKSIAMKILLLL